VVGVRRIRTNRIQSAEKRPAAIAAYTHVIDLSHPAVALPSP
jgi:hypothetical protein